MLGMRSAPWNANSEADAARESCTMGEAGRPTVRPPNSRVQDCDQGLSRTILPAPGGTKAVPSATYTAPLGPTATPPVKESAPPARNVWVPGLAKRILTTSPCGSSPQIQFGLVNSCEA